MENIPVPEGWGQDSLSDLFTHALANQMAAFVHLLPRFKCLTEINDAFSLVLKTQMREAEIPLGLFMSQTRAAYLSAASLSLSGMLPASYMAQRGCLESALYGCYVGNDVDRFKVWMERGKSEEAKKRCRNEFTIKAVMKSLKAVHAPTEKIAQNLYEWTIDCGAHPNQSGIISQLKGDNLSYVLLTGGVNP